MPSDSSNTKEFTKENLDFYLKELAKQYKKLYHPPVPVEIVLVGGAAVLAGYDFRMMTNDMDALSSSFASIKDAAGMVADKYGLPHDWLNSDFTNTASYSPAIFEHSKYYRTYSHAITFRTMSAEYLVAMKLMAGRRYKNDFSDIVGILREHAEKGCAIPKDAIVKAVEDLYGSWDAVPEENREYFEKLIQTPHTDIAYEEQTKQERTIKGRLIRFESEYPGVLSENNIDEIMEALNTRAEEQMQDAGAVPSPADRIKQFCTENRIPYIEKVDGWITACRSLDLRGTGMTGLPRMAVRGDLNLKGLRIDAAELNARIDRRDIVVNGELTMPDGTVRELGKQTKRHEKEHDSGERVPNRSTEKRENTEIRDVSDDFEDVFGER